MDPDVDLIRRAIARDDRAFGDLFDRHSIAVYRFAYAQTHDAVAAQELVQETFVTAWKKLADIHLIDESMLPWLLVTCRFHAQNFRRLLSRDDALPLDEHIANHHVEAVDRDHLAHVEEVEWVFEAINRLSDIDRRVVELCLYEGHSYKEAALALGISVNNVTKRVARSRATLRRLRAEEFEGGGLP